MTTHAPADERELVEVVQAALAARTPLQVIGGGSKRDVGNPSRTTLEVSTARFDRVIDYDPAELVMTVGAGVQLAHIEALLASHQQMLAFEPFDFAEISRRTPQVSTIGGVVAAGIAGSRRVAAGNVRDHLLGFTAVSGRGEAFVAGGRVVKNVTGYDVAKLMCGSWGQLAILTQLTLKVLPRPRVTQTLRIRGLDDERAVAAMTRALRSQAAIAAAAYIPRGLKDEHSHALLRLEGFGPSVEARVQGLSRHLSMQLETVDAEEAGLLWAGIRSAAMIGATDSDVLWRICIPSTAAVRLGAGIRDLRGKYCADWGGGLIWACVPEHVPAGRIRELAQSTGGHATILRAPSRYREQASALHPESPGVAALAQRVSAAFDPAGILDPLRFAELAA